MMIKIFSNKNCKKTGIFLICGLSLFISIISGCRQRDSIKAVISPDILYITPPVTSFSGIIEKIENNAIIVSKTVSVGKPIDLPDQPNVPVFPPKKLSYRVAITPETNFFRPFVPVPYLFKTPDLTSAPKLSMRDLKIGDQVSLVTRTDLRLQKKAEFKADSVNYITPSINGFNAKIVKIYASKEEIVLEVDANPFHSNIIETKKNPPENKIYKVIITVGTEISRLSPSKEFTEKPLPVKLNHSDLKEGMPVAIFTDGDISTSSETKALLIRPLDLNIPANPYLDVPLPVSALAGLNTTPGVPLNFPLPPDVLEKCLKSGDVSSCRQQK